MVDVTIRIGDFLRFVSSLWDATTESDRYLVLLFGLYVLAIFVFASFHYYRFRRDQDDFLLTDVVHLNQVRRATQRLKDQAASTAASIRVVGLFQRAVAAGHIRSEGSFRLKHGYTATLTEKEEKEAYTMQTSAWSELRITDDENNTGYFEQWWEPRLTENSIKAARRGWPQGRTPSPRDKERFDTLLRTLGVSGILCISAP